MNIKPSPFSHPWDMTPIKAIALQKRLASHVIRTSTLGKVTTVAGVDASYHDGIAQAAIATLRFPDLTLLEYTVATLPISYPYVPGLLSFREAPAVLKAFEQLKATPDLLIFDGHGIAHPRHFGLACHVGLLLDMPSIGCAKRRLCGQYQEPGRERGSVTLITDGDNGNTTGSGTIGAVVRTRTGIKPVFVSIGHHVDLSTAIDYVLACCKGYRLPETTRWADRIAGGERP